MRALLSVALAPILLLAGCVSPDGPAAGFEASTDPLDLADLVTVEWEGYVAVGVVDVFMHDIATEALFYDVQPAGFMLEVTEQPQAIEVMVSWQGSDAAFMLHPHYLLGDDEAGRTQYYGYHSDRFTTSPGCIRLNPEDMAPGVWPMMIHPSSEATHQAFTLTVGVLGGQAHILDELHGHRADRNYHIEDRPVEPCQLLMEGGMAGHDH